MALYDYYILKQFHIDPFSLSEDGYINACSALEAIQSDKYDFKITY